MDDADNATRQWTSLDIGRAVADHFGQKEKILSDHQEVFVLKVDQLVTSE